MATLKEQRQKLLVDAQSIMTEAQKGFRSITPEERTRIEDMLSKADELEKQIEQVAKDQELMQKMNSMLGDSNESPKATPGLEVKESSGLAKAKTVGEYVTKFVQEKGLSLDKPWDTPELKANTDTHTTGGIDGFYEPWLVDFQMDNPVRPVRVEPVVSDLISWATTTAQAIKYIEYPTALLEGSAGMVLEGGTKPQVHIGTPITKMDPVSEIAAWFKLTDDVMEDLPRLKSEIDMELRNNFADVEAAQILNGNGTSPNLRGILQRSGIQVLGYTPDTTGDALVKAILRAKMNVQTVLGRPADGLVIHPEDYFMLRTMQDANKQYYAGGPFNTIYQGTGLNWEVPIWGLRTVITPQAVQGSPIVARWTEAIAYRKGGLKIESTNSHENDFTNDRVTIRWRTKLGLAVRRPAAFVQIKPGA